MGTNPFRTTPKFKIWLPITPPPPPVLIINTRGGERFSWNRLFSAQGCNLEASWSKTPPSNNLYRVELVLKILSRSFHSIKSYLTCSQGQTDRHTPSHPYTHRQKLPPFLISVTSLREGWYNILECFFAMCDLKYKNSVPYRGCLACKG